MAGVRSRRRAHGAIHGCGGLRTAPPCIEWRWRLARACRCRCAARRPAACLLRGMQPGARPALAALLAAVNAAALVLRSRSSAPWGKALVLWGGERNRTVWFPWFPKRPTCIALDSSHLAFSAASRNRCTASLSLVRSMPCGPARHGRRASVSACRMPGWQPRRPQRCAAQAHGPETRASCLPAEA